MRAGYVGNSELQKRLNRPTPAVRPIVEALVVENTDVKVSQGDWQAMDDTTGIVIPDEGGTYLDRSASLDHATHDTAAADQENVITDLDKTSPWFFLELDWAHVDAPGFEIHKFIATIDPDVDGTGREAVELRCKLSAVTAIEDTHTEIVGISQVARADVSGNSQADFTFDFDTTVTTPRVNEGPGSGGSGLDNPRTWVLVWGVKADGSPAGNLAWVGDTDDAAGTTVNDGAGSSAANATVYNTTELSGAGELNVGGRFVRESAVSGVPDFTIRGSSYSAATATFSTDSNEIDLGSSPASSNDLVVHAQGEEPSDSTLTWEVYDGTSWVECFDGDLIGEDNTSDGGADLSGVPRQQTYHMRVTLSPNSAGGVTPVARRLGVEERTSTILWGQSTLSGEPRWSFDPLTLVGEIPEVEITLIKDGDDFRSEVEKLLAENHIGDLTFRLWIGHQNLDKRYWLHVDDFLVDNTSSAEGGVRITGLSPLDRLGIGVPPYDSANDERTPVTYTNSTLKAAWDDLIDSQIALSGRYRGPGVEDTTSETVTRELEDSTGKAELDAIAHLAGGTVTTSQGRVKYQSAFLEGGVEAVFLREEVNAKSATPGYADRVAEYYVRYNWDKVKEEFDGEVRSFNADALSKLGTAHVDSPERAEDSVSRWLPDPQDTGSNAKDKNLAAFVAHRTADEIGTGIPQFRFQCTDAPHPELEVGDPIAVQTEHFVFKHPESDQPIRGVIWVLGVIQAQMDVMGREWVLWVQQVYDMTPNEVDVSRISFANPEVTGASGSWDDAGNVDVTGKVREADAVRIATSTSSFPSKSTTQSASLQSVASDNTFDVSGLTTINVGQTAYISILAYENSDGSGAESTLFKTKVFRNTQEATQNLLASTAGDEKQNTNTFVKTEVVTLSDIRAQVGDILSASGLVKSATGSDEVRMEIRYRDSSDTTIRTDQGSSHTGSAYEFETVENSQIPANTDDIVVFARNVDTTEQASATHFMLNLGPVALSFVEPPARVGRGEVEEGAEVNPPAIEITSFSAIDDGTDINYTVNWSPSSNVSDADNSVEATFIDRGGTPVDTASESSPSSNTQLTGTDSGAGDGTADDGWHGVELELLNSNGNTISTVSSKTLEAV